MSTTIHNQPALQEPVGNYLWYKVSSTNSAKPQFKFIADTYINNQFIMRVANAPAPDGYLYYDASTILEAYVTNDASTLVSSPILACSNTYVNGGKVVFGEQWYTGNTVATYSGTSTGTTIYPYNGLLEYYDRVNYNQSNYLVGSTSSKFLTHMESGVSIVDGQYQWLSFIRNSTAYDRYKVTTYNADGSVLNYAVISISGITASLNSGGRYIRIPASKANISTLSAGYFLDGDSSVFDDSPSYYTIQVLNTSNTASSEAFRFNILEAKCRSYTDVIFMNSFGAFESFRFSLAKTERIKTKQENYINNNPLSNLGYTQADRNITRLSTNYSRTYTALSDWISPEESDWLRELITSPIAFVLDGTTLSAINVLNDDDYEVYDGENKQLFNIKLIYEYANKEARQRG